MALLTSPVRTQPPVERPPERELDWGAAGWAGIIGALVYIFLEVGPLLFGGNPWRPVRMIADIALHFLPSPHPTAGAVFLAALAVHLPLSLIYARMIAFLTYDHGPWAALLVGALFGLAIYFLNFYVFTSVFPWFAAARSARSILDHVIFGLVTAWAYKRLEGRFPPI